MRHFKKAATLILAVVMGLATFAGCDIVSKDNARDLSQVVTTVKIQEDAPTETIYKRDLAFNYLMSESWQNVYQGQSTKEAEMEKIYNSLLKTSVIYQVALRDLNGIDGFIKDSTKGIWEAERYLTAEDIEEIKYTVNKNFNDSIESYLEEDDDELDKDTDNTETRTAPTNAENEQKELKYADWLAYNTDPQTLYGKGVNAGFTKDATTGAISLNSDVKAREKRDAYNTLLKSLDSSGLLAKNNTTFDFDKDTIYDSYYYDYSIKSQTRRKIISIWENYQSAQIMKGYTYSDVSAFYADNVYEVQKNAYGNDASAYATALDDASKESPVVYNPYDGYGYVYNLLIGADTVQKAEISALSSTLSNEEKSDARKSILSKTTVTDLRSSWITANYDSTFSEGVVTFINDYSYNKGADKLSFQGVVDWNNYVPIADREDDYESDAYVKSLKCFSLNEFVDFMEDFVYGSAQAGESLTGLSNDYYKIVDNNSTVANYDQKVKDLLFAFSTDTGSLSKTYKGYLVKPYVDSGESETYVAEFQMAAKKVLELGKSSYTMVATDYGYHIIFYSEKVIKGTNYATLCDYLNKDAADYDTFKYDGTEYTGMVDFFNQKLGKTVTLGSITDNDWKDFYDFMVNDIETFTKSDLKDFYLFTLQQGKSSYFTTLLTDKEETIIYNFMYKDGKPIEDFVKIYKDRFSDYYEFKYLDKDAEE